MRKDDLKALLAMYEAGRISAEDLCAALEYESGELFEEEDPLRTAAEAIPEPPEEKPTPQIQRWRERWCDLLAEVHWGRAFALGVVGLILLLAIWPHRPHLRPGTHTRHPAAPFPRLHALRDGSLLLGRQRDLERAR